MKKVWWGILPVLSCALIVLWWVTRDSKSQPSTRDSELTQNLMDRISTLEADSERTRRELALRRVVASQQLLAQPEETEEKVVEAGAAAADQDESKAKGAKLRERQREAMGVFEKELEARTASETLDSAWTRTVESSFRQELNTLPETLKFESAACGSSLCRVVVSHESDRAHVDLATEMRTKMRDYAGQLIALRHEDPVGGYRTTFYLAKPGERIAGASAAMSGEHN